MNAASQHTHAVEAPLTTDALSALQDGELDAYEMDALLVNTGNDPSELNARWLTYHLVGEALRGEPLSAPLMAPKAFLAGVMAGLPEAQDAPLRLQATSTVAHVRAPAANDALLRWKLVAGVASLSAVMAVGWGVLRIAPGSAASDDASAMQLVVSPVAQTTALAMSQPVEVKTQLGTLIRDARLEQLLAEHRQFGGASALQTPAGFLRSATYEAAPSR